MKRSGVDAGGIKISLALVNDARMKKIKKKFWGRAQNSDVAAFPLHEKDPQDGVYWLGEIVVNHDQARRQAKKYGVSLREELARLIAHSALHLLGYQDKTPSQRLEIEKVQERVVKNLKFKI